MITVGVKAEYEGKKITIMKYQELKNKARQDAIEWQINSANENPDYSELSLMGDHFYRLGKRYGLLKEFRENGIIC